MAASTECDQTKRLALNFQTLRSGGPSCQEGAPRACVSASRESCPHLPPPGLPCPRPPRSWGTSLTPARPWGATGASGARPAPPCSPPGLRRRRGPRRPETRPRRRTHTPAGRTWGPGSRQSLAHRSPNFLARSAAGGGAPSLSAAEAPQLTVKALLGPNTSAFPSPHPAPRTSVPAHDKLQPRPPPPADALEVANLHLILERPPS